MDRLNNDQASASWVADEHPSTGKCHRLMLAKVSKGGALHPIAVVQEFPNCYLITCDNGRGEGSNCAGHGLTLEQAKKDAEITCRDFGWVFSMTAS
jgi:hypothetical protein